MSNFRYSICEPVNPEIIEKGRVDSSEIVQIFECFPWKLHLEKMENAKNIYYSPSIEFENLSNKNALAISAVGTPDQYEFYIFFKRPKVQKTWFGFSEKLNNNYTSDLLDQNKETTIELLKALVDNNLNYLESRF
ncbi:hypothetical protein [Flavobacterium bizetiae]|uniref:hypothetical protein n=1 Tax=Flavobacterium bizetiae TaxID=2704140 RepID=UPI003757C90D